MAEAPFVEIARVIKAHGLKGELSVAPLLSPDFPLAAGTEVYFVPPRSAVRSGRVTTVRQGPKGPLVGIDTVTSIDIASSLAGTSLVVRVEDAPDAYLETPLDVVGMTVEDEIRGALGRIEEIIETGANDVWIVRGPLGEVLVPVIDDVVLSVDEATRHVRVNLLPGLLPGEGDEA